MSPPRFGAVAAAITLFADQASKLLLLFGLDLQFREAVTVTPFLNLVAVRNHGISYGLLQQHSELGRWLLVILSIAATVAIAWWLARTDKLLPALALGLIGGGAIGNAIDRMAYGWVFDFAQFHLGAYSWYVFNVADVAIVAGVIGLLYNSLVSDRRIQRRA